MELTQSMLQLTQSMLLAYKREITRILDAPELPSMGNNGLCSMLSRTDAGGVRVKCEGRCTTPLSYEVSYRLLTNLDYLRSGMGPGGEWTDKRYEYLWLIDLLTDSEFLELFPDALKA